MHIPVMLREVIAGLGLKSGMVVIDATVGGGGHTEAMLMPIGKTGRLLGLDKDKQTLTNVKERLKSRTANFVHADFANLESVAYEHGFQAVDAILFDLGFSSLQLDDPSRGFSFQLPGPLDMRLDSDASGNAADIINRASERVLTDIFYRYGELYDAKRIANIIVRERGKKPIKRTTELVQLLGFSNPGVKAKIFQALRIAVNNELTKLETAIPQAVSLLKPGGRVAIISFHSLEDRIVKNTFKANHLLKIITKKPLIPAEREIKANPRSRSAKLRIAEKLLT